MRRWLVLVVSLALVLSSCGGDAGPDPAAAEAAPGGARPRDTVTVQGTGVARGAPDVARTTVGVEVTRETVEDATRDADAAARAVLDALRANGVDADDIRTTQLAIRPEHRFTDHRPPELRGYTVTNLVEVTVHDVDRAGEVLSAVARAGGDATRVEQISFEVDDDEALLAEARARAFADARRRAAQYAELSDGSLGGIVSITEGPAHAPPMPFAAGAVDAEEASAIPISRGTQEVTVHVQVVWSLE